MRSRRWVVSQKRPRATRVVFGKFACLPPCRIDQNAAGESKRFCFGVHGTTSSASQTFRLERPSRRQVVTQVTPSGSVTRTEPIGSVRWTSFLHNNLFRLWGKYCGGEGVTFLLFNNGKKENRRVGGGRRANWVRLSESRVNDSRLLKEHCPREQVSEENTLRQILTGDSVKTVLLPIKKQEMTAELWQVDRVERRKIGEGPDRVPDSVEMSPDECSCVWQFN